MERWNAGLGDCTADPPKDGSAAVFKAEALRAQSKEFLYSDLCELCGSVVKYCFGCGRALS
jgi:hypothetical protein